MCNLLYIWVSDHDSHRIDSSNVIYMLMLSICHFFHLLASIMLACVLYELRINRTNFRIFAVFKAAIARVTYCVVSESRVHKVFRFNIQKY